MYARPAAARICIALITLALLVVTGACSNKKKSKAKEQKPTPASVEGLAAIPANASAVIGVDVAKLATSPVVERALERMFARDPELRGDLEAVLDACGINLKTDLQAATLALLPREEQSDALLVAQGAFKEGLIIACLGRFLGESGGRLETSELDGRPLYHQVSESAPGIWLAFGSDRTLLLASSREAIALSLASGPKLASAKSGVARHLGRTRSEAELWGIGNVDAAVGQGLVAATQEAVKPPKTILGSASLSEGLALRMEVEMGSEEDAKTLISQATIQLQAAALVLQIDAAGRLIQKIQASTEGPWAILDWQLSEQELADLVGANLSGLSSTIDNDGDNVENPAPKSETAGDTQDGNSNPDAGS